MAEVKIEMTTKIDPRVKAFREFVPGIARTTLFEWDNWIPVEHVALAFDEQGSLAMGTLAPTNEMGAPVPTIIGVWVLPHARGQGVGVAILSRLAEECLRFYGKRAHVVAVTVAGVRTCQNAVAAGAQLDFIDCSMGFFQFELLDGPVETIPPPSSEDDAVSSED